MIITRVIEDSGYDTFKYRVKLGANKLETETEKLFASFRPVGH